MSAPFRTDASSGSVAIVILNWRRGDLVRRCVASIAAQRATARMHVIVFENEFDGEGRSDIVDMLTELHADSDNRVFSASLLGSPANLGFAAAMNRAVEFARERFHPDFVWLLNNDAQPEANALQGLLEAAETRPDWGVIGSVIHGEPLARGRPLYGGYRYQRWLSRLQPCLAPNCNPDYIAGAAMFVRAALFDRVGYLSEKFFLYGEELDFARRAVRAGWRLGCAQDSVVWHHSGESVGARSPLPGRSAAWAREYFENRSAFLLAWRLDRLRFPVAVLARLGGKSLRAVQGRCRFGAVVAALATFGRPLPETCRATNPAIKVYFNVGNTVGNG